MAKDRFAPKPLEDVLSNLPNRLKQFSHKNKENKKLEEMLADILDANMFSKCTIANYEQGTLVLNAQSAAVAMRLNYIKMNMMSEFRKRGLPELGQIKIQTSPRSAISSQKNNLTKAKPEKKRISKETQQSLLEVAKNAPDSLREKLEKLAKLADK